MSSIQGFSLGLMMLRCYRLIWFVRGWPAVRALAYTVCAGWHDLLYWIMAEIGTAFLFGLIMFGIEHRDEDNDQFHMKHMPDTMWWAFSTLTTVSKISILYHDICYRHL